MNTKSKHLLVDDEIAITDRLEPFLTRAGFEVMVVADGEAALREIVSFSTGNKTPPEGPRVLFTPDLQLAISEKYR